MRTHVRPPTIVVVALAVGLFTACDGDGLVGTGSQATGPVSLSVFAPTQGSSSQSARTTGIGPSFAITRSDDQGNDLTIDSVKVVLREIELERAEDECPDDGSSGDDDDPCEEFSTDIRLFDVPLDGSVDRAITIENVPADTYDELEFEVHKPDDDEAAGRQFIEDHPQFADVSIRAVGTFNGEAFVFEQDLNEEQEIELVPALMVDEGTETLNVTLRLDVATWFVDSAGEVGSPGEILDPRLAHKDSDRSDVQNVVEENIRNSIEAFEDNDEDGEDDG